MGEEATSAWKISAAGQKFSNCAQTCRARAPGRLGHVHTVYLGVHYGVCKVGGGEGPGPHNMYTHSTSTGNIYKFCFMLIGVCAPVGRAALCARY